MAFTFAGVLMRIPAQAVRNADAFLHLRRWLVTAAAGAFLAGLVSGDPALAAGLPLAGSTAARQIEAQLTGRGCFGAGIKSSQAAFKIGNHPAHVPLLLWPLAAFLRQD